MVKSDPYVPKFDAKKAASERAARIKKSDRDLVAGPGEWSVRKAKRMGVLKPLPKMAIGTKTGKGATTPLTGEAPTNLREWVVNIPGHTTWGVKWDSPPNDGCAVRIWEEVSGEHVAGGGVIGSPCNKIYFTEDDGLGIVAGKRYKADVWLFYGITTGETAWSGYWAARGNIGSLPLAAFFGRCDCSSSTGSFLRPPVFTDNPINTGTGALTEVIQDAKVAAPGIGLDVTRTYNSADTRGGLLGRGWTFPYEAALKVSADKAIYRAEDGQRVEYVKNTDGTFKTPVGVTSKLTAVSGGYTLTMKSFTTLGFDASGRLSSWKDGSGQGLTFGYDTNGLAKITDAAGRDTTVEVASGRVRKFTLPDGRYVAYGYVDAQLASVRDLRGKLWKYEYDDNDRLAKMIDPTGVATVQTTYNATTGRVATQIEPGNTTPARYAWNEATGEATWTDSRGQVWTYTYAGGLLVEEIDPRGYVTTYRYNTNSELIEIVDKRNNSTVMTYDARHNLASRTDAEGGLESWEYDTADRLIKSVDKLGKVSVPEYTDADAPQLPSRVSQRSKDGSQTRATSTAYNARGLTETQTSFAGRVTTSTYDAQGNLATKKSELGNTTTFTYDTVGRVKTATDPRGTATAEDGDFTTTYSYDEADHVSSVKNARGHTTTFAFNDVGDVAVETDAYGKKTEWTYDAARRKKTRHRDGWAAAVFEKWQYDPNGNLVKHTEPTGGVETYGWNASNQQVTMITARGNAEGGSPGSYIWYYGIDQNGNRTSVKTPPILQSDGTSTLTYETKTSYDKADRPKVVTDPLGHATTTDYDLAGNVIAVTNHLGEKTASGYDGLGRKVSETSPRGTATATPVDDYQSKFGYDADDLSIAVTSPLGFRTSYGYDQDGRRTSMIDPRGNVTGADPAAFTWVYGYDKAGNQISVKDPLGHSTVTGYDPNNNISSVKDANSHTTSYAYDDKDRLAKVTAPDAAETGYGYDALDNLTSVTDPRQNTTTYGFDAMGRIIETVDPLGRKITHEYGSEGQRTATITARGNQAGADPVPWKLGYNYDPRGLTTAVKSPDLGVNATYTYDGAGRKTVANNSGGDVTYAYDDANRLTTAGRGTGTFTYLYDKDGNVTSRTGFDGTVVKATFDADQRQIESYRAGTSKMTFSYFENNLLRGVFYPTTSTRNQSYNYDNAGRLTKTFSGPEATALSKYEVTRDNAGNPSKVVKTGTSGASTQTFTYDEQDRVTAVCYAEVCAGATKQIGYGYDKSGNRTTETRVGVANPGTTTYTHDAADQIIKSTTGGVDATYGYDADGNLTKAGAANYTYDVANRLKSSSGIGASLTYAYDAEGRRIRISSTAEATKLFYWDPNYNDGLARLGVEAIGTSRQAWRYTDTGLALETTIGTTGEEAPTLAQAGSRQALNAQLDKLAQSTTDATVTDSAWLYHDWLGSVVDTTNGANGVVETHTDYEPYGTPTTTKTTGAVDPRLGYTGEYTDPNSQQHLRARQYDLEGDRSRGHLRTGFTSSRGGSDGFVEAEVHRGVQGGGGRVRGRLGPVDRGGGQESGNQRGHAGQLGAESEEGGACGGTADIDVGAGGIA